MLNRKSFPPPLVKKLPSEQKNNNTAAPTATELAALPRHHPYVQSLHYDPIDHPPPRLCFSATAGAATPASIHNTIIDACPLLPATAAAVQHNPLA